MAASPAWVAGADGCRGGWVIVLRQRATGELRVRTAARFADVLALPEQPRVIALDMPIALPQVAVRGGRDAERAARALLGRRGCTVFSSPTVGALAAFRAGGDHRAVSAANRRSAVGAPGLTLQTYYLLRKIDEVAQALTHVADRVVIEAHPELAFLEANGGAPIIAPKHTPSGRRARTRLLARLGYLPAARRRAGAAVDDLLDACIVCWTAERRAAGRALVVPARAPVDARGISTGIWR